MHMHWGADCLRGSRAAAQRTTNWYCNTSFARLAVVQCTPPGLVFGRAGDLQRQPTAKIMVLQVGLTACTVAVWQPGMQHAQLQRAGIKVQAMA